MEGTCKPSGLRYAYQNGWIKISGFLIQVGGGDEEQGEDKKDFLLPFTGCLAIPGPLGLRLLFGSVAQSPPPPSPCPSRPGSPVIQRM